jgi:glycine/D-amino acid oxidase-like deaminating enzyme
MSIFAENLKQTPWWWEAAPRPSAPPPALPAEADAVVIGSGYTGLSAALTLARAGRSVLVCEADDPGAGASARNGGMIGSGHRLSYTALAGRYGEAAATALLGEGNNALDFTTGLIANEAIDCQYYRSGRFRAACRAADYDVIGREIDLLRDRIGLDADMVPRTEQQQEVATDFYHGGCVYNRHGSLHPGLFHQGLLDRAIDAGALVAGQTPVTAIARAGAGFDIETTRGAVAAGNVIVATNGYTGDITRALKRRVIPLSSYIIATEELPAERVRALIPSRRMIVEDRALHGYYRPSPDGRRILFGGRAALHAIDPRRAGRRLYHYLVELFPDLADVRISHSWSGHIAYTWRDMPHIGRRDGIHYALGYCGSGVAMAPYLGYRAAHKVLGTADGDTAFDDIDFPAVPWNAGHPRLLPAIDLYYRARMRLFG